jgi:hypothetical protein
MKEPSGIPRILEFDVTAGKYALTIYDDGAPGIRDTICIPVGPGEMADLKRIEPVEQPEGARR